MPQITYPTRIVLLVAGLAMLIMGGCGSSDSRSSFSSDSGSHPANWTIDGHKDAAVTNINDCIECHGSDFNGGISKVSCMQCHIGSERRVHPNAWNSTSYYLEHGPYVLANDTTSCATAVCHGNNLSGVQGSGPSCSSCHLGGPMRVHPADWTAPNSHGLYVTQNGPASCTNMVCHGPQAVGVVNSGPACVTCHN